MEGGGLWNRLRAVQPWASSTSSRAECPVGIEMWSGLQLSGPVSLNPSACSTIFASRGGWLFLNIPPLLPLGWMGKLSPSVAVVPSLQLATVPAGSLPEHLLPRVWLPSLRHVLGFPSPSSSVAYWPLSACSIRIRYLELFCYYVRLFYQYISPTLPCCSYFFCPFLSLLILWSLPQRP